MDAHRRVPVVDARSRFMLDCGSHDRPASNRHELTLRRFSFERRRARDSRVLTLAASESRLRSRACREHAHLPSIFADLRLNRARNSRPATSRERESAPIRSQSRRNGRRLVRRSRRLALLGRHGPFIVTSCRAAIVRWVRDPESWADGQRVCCRRRWIRFGRERRSRCQSTPGRVRLPEPEAV